MSNAEYEQLKEEVRLLAQAVDELEHARANDTSQEQIDILTAKVEKMSLSMDKQFAAIVKLLSGNGGNGTVSVLDTIIDTLKAMGNVVGEMHRGEQMNNAVMERILAKLKFEDVLLQELRVREVGNMRDAIAGVNL